MSVSQKSVLLLLEVTSKFVDGLFTQDTLQALLCNSSNVLASFIASQIHQSLHNWLKIGTAESSCNDLDGACEQSLDCTTFLDLVSGHFNYHLQKNMNKNVLCKNKHYIGLTIENRTDTQIS